MNTFSFGLFHEKFYVLRYSSIQGLNGSYMNCNPGSSAKMMSPTHLETMRPPFPPGLLICLHRVVEQNDND